MAAQVTQQEMTEALRIQTEYLESRMEGLSKEAYERAKGVSIDILHKENKDSWEVIWGVLNVCSPSSPWYFGASLHIQSVFDRITYCAYLQFRPTLRPTKSKYMSMTHL